MREHEGISHMENSYAHITVQQVANEVRNLANQHPDFVYTPPEPGSCKYVHGTKAGCGVGQALANLGVDLGDLREFEGEHALAVMHGLGIDVAGLQGDSSTDEDAKFILTFQRNQDQSRTWGQSVRNAEKSGVYV